MKLLLALIGAPLAFAAPLPDSLEAFRNHAKTEHGTFGEKAADFLIEHLPLQDRKQLSTEFLNENLDLALLARERFPWAGEVPEEIFLNDVLPYAVFDEPRDPWRADFLEKATPIVKGATTASEAAQRLNQQFFKRINTHYNTKRKRTNQSPRESIEQGKATCTGLSIILVDACRAVGIPARAVGTPMWSNGRGNHTWVEIWDDGWHFTGADEFDPKGLNRGWFVGDAAKARADQPIHAIYATSWKRDGLAFPLVWSPRSQAVAAVNVTHRYLKSEDTTPVLGIRFFAEGERQAVEGVLTNESGEVLQKFVTKAGTTDLNDMPSVKVTPGETYRLRFQIDGHWWQSQPITAEAGETTFDAKRAQLIAVDAEAPESAGDPQSAAPGIKAIYQEILKKEKAARAAELKAREIKLGDLRMKWLEKTFGAAPTDGRSLWISMHGGGGAPARVNDQQWQNQIKLYKPKEGIYVAPRAPTDTWNLWHQGHIDPMFSRLIENMVALRDVNPNKVYLMGYSAGGDGVWQLGPRMADRFAAASMMAGHPNEAQLDGLRNLPFGIFMGGNDRAYDRNKIAAQRITQMARLQADDPGGYVHLGRVYEGMGHWMNLRDAESVPWMAGFERNPWPKKIVWLQDDVTHDRFYWLQLPKDAARKGQRITAEVKDQVIKLTGDVPQGTRILLSDKLLDLAKPITVTVNGQPAQTFTVKPDAAVIREALTARLDPAACPQAAITLN